MNVLNLTKWFFPKINKIGFEDIKYSLEHPNNYIIINTMSISEQSCLIKNTISIHTEENVINDLIDNYETKKTKIIIYGTNSTDETVEYKYKQLVSLGFTNVYVYLGGLFEWVILQDIYGFDEFPTTQTVVDILKWKPSKIIF